MLPITIINVKIVVFIMLFFYLQRVANLIITLTRDENRFSCYDKTKKNKAK